MIDFNLFYCLMIFWCNEFDGVSKYFSGGVSGFQGDDSCQVEVIEFCFVFFVQ